MTLRIVLALLLLLAPAFGQTAGTISTVAGTGVAGFNGDGGPAVQATLNFGIGDTSVDEEDIIHITVDAAGNIYFPDRDNHRIRKVDAAGKISTVAGNGTYDFKGDGGPATSAALAWASSVKLDSAGNLVIADQQNNAVRRVGADGVIRTIAGAPPDYGSAGNGGPATKALMDYPTDVAFDSTGNMYIADQFNSWVRRVSTDGVMSVFAGDAAQPNAYAFSGDGGPANKATLDFPAGVAVDRSGNVYFADQFNHRIRRVLPDGTIATVAGSGRNGGAGGGYAGDGAPATSALLNFPVDVAVDGFGNLFIADQKNDRIRMVSTSGIITTVAGNGQKGFSGDGGPATQASLDGPSGVALDASGNLYIVDHYNNRIRKVAVAPTAAFPAQGVVSAASFLPGHVSPGQIISIFGVNLGPATGVSGALDPATGKLATTLSDTTVLFNNIPGPLFFVRQDQINVQVPYEVSLAGNAQIVVRSKVRTSSTVLVPTGPSAPAIFSTNQSGKGQGAILNQDNSNNSAANPADRGSVVQIFMTGQGAVSPSVPTGALAPTQPPLALTSLPVTVTIGGKTATKQFSGLAPGLVGLLQVNAFVPQDVTPGAAVELSVKIGDISSQGNMTLAVR